MSGPGGGAAKGKNKQRNPDDDMIEVVTGTDEEGKPVTGQMRAGDVRAAYLKHRRNNPEFAGGDADGMAVAQGEKRRSTRAKNRYPKAETGYGSNWSDDAGMSGGQANDN